MFFLIKINKVRSWTDQNVKKMSEIAWIESDSKFKYYDLWV